MVMGGLGDGCGELRAGLRQLSGISRLLRPQAVVGGQLELSPGHAALCFLSEARWDDDGALGRLQEYLAPRLGHPEAVWVLDGSDFPKQGRKLVEVARQYCGRLGKAANCQAGMFLVG